MDPHTRAAIFDELEKIAFTLRDVRNATLASGGIGAGIGAYRAKKKGKSKLRGALKGGAVGASVPIGAAAALMALNQ